MKSRKIIMSFLTLLTIVVSCSNDIQDVAPPHIEISATSVTFDNPKYEQSFTIYVDSDVEWNVDYSHDSWFDVESLPYLNKKIINITSSVNNLGVARSGYILIYPLENKEHKIKIEINQQAHQSFNILDNILDDRFKSILIEKYFKRDYVTELDASQISSIDCIGMRIRSLTGIEYFENLERLDCSFNFLLSIDISNNKKLENLNVSSNLLKELALYYNTKLKTIDCSNNNLISIDFHSNEILNEIHCYSNQINMLDLTNNEQLTLINCSFNPISEVIISKKVSENSFLIPHKESGIYSILSSRYNTLN